LIRNTRRSLDVAYGDKKTPEEKERLARTAFEQLSRVLAEDIYFLTHPKRMVEKVGIRGEEHLKAALAKGKGVVAVTGHFGNFPLMIAWLSYQGYKVSVIMRRMRDVRVTDYILKRIAPSGVKIIFTDPVRECVQGSISALRRNEILFILIDQNYGADARVPAEFFGKKVWVGASPVTFALRTGAAIVPIFSLREGADRHCVCIEPAVPLEEDRQDADTTEKNVQKLTVVIERYIRAHPALWSWMHNRWKDIIQSNED